MRKAMWQPWVHVVVVDYAYIETDRWAETTIYIQADRYASFIWNAKLIFDEILKKKSENFLDWNMTLAFSH